MKAVLLGPVWTFLPGPWAPATAVKAGKPPIGLEVECTHTDSSSVVESMPPGLVSSLCRPARKRLVMTSFEARRPGVAPPTWPRPCKEAQLSASASWRAHLRPGTIHKVGHGGPAPKEQGARLELVDQLTGRGRSEREDVRKKKETRRG